MEWNGGTVVCSAQHTVLEHKAAALLFIHQARDMTRIKYSLSLLANLQGYLHSTVFVLVIRFAREGRGAELRARGCGIEARYFHAESNRHSSCSLQSLVGALGFEARAHHPQFAEFERIALHLLHVLPRPALWVPDIQLPHPQEKSLLTQIRSTLEQRGRPCREAPDEGSITHVLDAIGHECIDVLAGL